MREVWTVLRELTTNWEEEINSYGHAHWDGIRRVGKILIKSHWSSWRNHRLLQGAASFLGHEFHKSTG